MVGILNSSSLFIFLKINLFIYLFIFGCVGSLLLRAGFSLVVASLELLPTEVREPLTAAAFPAAEHGL